MALSPGTRLGVYEILSTIGAGGMGERSTGRATRGPRLAREVFTGETVSLVMAAVLKTDPDWTALPKETPATRLSFLVSGMRFYDVSPDGRFLMVKSDTPTTPRQLHLVVNWFEELKRLVPAGKKL